MERSPGRTRTALAALAAVFGLALAGPAVGDQVYLKGGGRLSGVIVERTPTMLTLETPPGRVGVPLSRVERVVESHSALAEYLERAARLGPADATGWLALAQWARAQGLLTQSREAAERVLAVEARNAEANGLLGNVQFEGRWMRPDEARRASGLVQFEGEWMTPTERAGLLRARTESALAETARAEAEARAREAEARAREAEADARRAEAGERAADSGSNGVPLWLGGGPAVILGPDGGLRPPRTCVGDCRSGHGRGGHGAGTASGPPPRPQPRVDSARPNRDGGSARPRPEARHGARGGYTPRVEVDRDQD